MDKIIYIIFILISESILGQEYPQIDTLDFGDNVYYVKHFMQYDGKEEKLIETYWYNDYGKHSITYSGYKDLNQSKILYEYNKNGHLTSVKKIFYISPYNDSIIELSRAEIIKYFNKGLSESEINWKNFYAKYDTLYEVVNPEKVRWISKNETHPGILIKRNHFGLDSLIEIYNQLRNNECYLDEMITFSYNKQKRLIRKRFTDVPNENIIKIQAFKPNSTDFEDSVNLLSGSYKEKWYNYLGDTLKMQYFVNGSYSGYEVQITINNLKKEIVFNANNDTLSYFINTYNSKKLLISRHRIKHTGYNGFGYSMDLSGVNFEKYKYDSENRLIRIDAYADKKHLYVERFEIIKK